MTKSGLKLGFVGLGIMGTPMAGHLQKAGHMLFVHTRSKVPQELADGGATVCTTARGVAERAGQRLFVAHAAEVNAEQAGARSVTSAGSVSTMMTSSEKASPPTVNQTRPVAPVVTVPMARADQRATR